MTKLDSPWLEHDSARGHDSRRRYDDAREAIERMNAKLDDFIVELQRPLSTVPAVVPRLSTKGILSASYPQGRAPLSRSP